MEIIGIVFVILGLALGTHGASVLYSADFPRNDWILEAMYQAAQKPSHGLITPDDYDPQAEMESNVERVRKVAGETQKFESTTKRGMKEVLYGFILQVVGNIFLLWPLVNRYV